MNSDTRFMDPSFGDGKFFPPPMWPKPGFSITGREGNWIRKHIKNPERTIKADISSKWEWMDVESYNVIGQITGRDTSTVSIVCAHYDCWWNQGVIDEGTETALVLGIAEYMTRKMKKGASKPLHTVKFICFSGEEQGMRGSKDYVKKYVIDGNEKKENIKYVINPGNFGHIDRCCIPFRIDTSNEDLTKKITKIANEMAKKYNYNIPIDYGEELGAEDSKMFQNLTEDDGGAIQFSRWPYKGYHRDGEDPITGKKHTQGDILDILDTEVVKKECEIVGAITTYLTTDWDPAYR